MSRRIFVLGLCPMFFASAQTEDVSHSTLLDVLAQFTSSLSEGNPSGAIEMLDTSQPGVAGLAKQLRDLSAVGEISSLVDPLEWPNQLTVVLDWLLEIRSSELNGGLKRKQEKVTCRFVKKGKKWKIASLEPVGLFLP